MSLIQLELFCEELQVILYPAESKVVDCGTFWNW
jgi:hypothetical protein